jgi:hypothetical protein
MILPYHFLAYIQRIINQYNKRDTCTPCLMKLSLQQTVESAQQLVNGESKLYTHTHIVHKKNEIMSFKGKWRAVLCPAMSFLQVRNKT